MASRGAPKSGEPPRAVVLGTVYSPMPPGGLFDTSSSSDEQARSRHRLRVHLHSRGWFTYRKNFPPLGPARLTSDSGWGCMLRAGQMMLCEALFRVFLGDKWGLAENEALPDSFMTYKTILSWFQDAKISSAPYSLHNMAEIGQALKTPIGEWHGPSSLAHILAALVNKHSPRDIGCVVGSDGTLYASDIKFSFAGGSSSVIILLPLRLGIELNPAYIPILQAMLALPQTIGFAGGKPGSPLATMLGAGLGVKRLRALQAMHFVGVDADGSFLCLDPHRTQPSLDADPRTCTQDQLGSYHCTSPRRVSADAIDPSVLLGFLVRDADDFDAWRRSVAAIKRCPFTVSDSPRAPPLRAGSSSTLLAADTLDDSDDDFDASADASEKARSAAAEIAPYASPRTSTAPGIARVVPVRRKDLCWLLTSDGPVRGVLVVTPHRVYFEPLQQDPLVRAFGPRKYRLALAIGALSSVRLEDETDDAVLADEAVEPKEQFVLLNTHVAAASAAGEKPERAPQVLTSLAAMAVFQSVAPLVNASVLSRMDQAKSNVQSDLHESSGNTGNDNNAASDSADSASVSVPVPASDDHDTTSVPASVPISPDSTPDSVPASVPTSVPASTTPVSTTTNTTSNTTLSLHRSTEASLRRLLVGEQSIRPVLLNELQHAITRVQLRSLGPSSTSTPHVAAALRKLTGCDESTRALLERIELVLRHGLCESLVGLFGRRVTILRPLLAAHMPADELAQLKATCGPKPDDAFFVACWLRLALTRGSLTHTLWHVHTSEGPRGYYPFAIMAMRDQFFVFTSMLGGLRDIEFDLPVVEVPLEQGEEDAIELEDYEQHDGHNDHIAHNDGHGHIGDVNHIEDGVDAEALVQTAGYAYDDAREDVTSEKERVLRIETRRGNVFAVRMDAAGKAYGAIAEEMEVYGRRKSG